MLRIEACLDELMINLEHSLPWDTGVSSQTVMTERYFSSFFLFPFFIREGGWLFDEVGV